MDAPLRTIATIRFHSNADIQDYYRHEELPNEFPSNLVFSSELRITIFLSLHMSVQRYRIECQNSGN